MVAASEYHAILGGAARPVDVVAIERELTTLWKAAADDTLEGHPVVRACVLNLVAYAASDDVAGHINEVLAQVSGRHPSRSIVIVAAPRRRGSRLRASISARCQIAPEGGKQVCSEQITLSASGAALDEVHGTVLPLLVKDLPVILWWHGEPPFDNHLFLELLRSSDRLVVNSAEFGPGTVASALSGLQGLARETGVAVSDLNWSRLTPWRELVAQFFDAGPARRYLDRLDRVTVRVSARRGRDSDFAEALLLVGWLASRLGWRMEDGARGAPGEAMSFTLRSASGPVQVDLTAVRGHRRGGLWSVVLGAGDDTTFSISRDVDDETCASVAVVTPEGAAPPRAVRMGLPTEADLLCEVLDVLGEDVAFRDALAQAAEFTKGWR